MSIAQTDAGGLNGGSLTSYKAAASGGQGILPSYAQRASSIGFGGGEADGGLADVDTFLRTPRISALDLRFPSDGYSVTISRSYNGWQSTASNGFQGKNWFQDSRPELVRGTNATSNDMLYMVVGANRVMEFQRVGTSTTVFAGVNGTLATAKVTTDGSGNPGTIEIRDLSGFVWTFFDFDGDAQGAQGQLWKVTNADGNGTTAYVGTSSSMSDALAAFEQDSGVRTARVTTFIDSSDRRFAYTYTTAGGAKRLTSVVASIKTGGTWASPTGLSEVGRVEYEYYDGVTDTGNGNAGDLKWATVTMPLSTGSSLESKTYYRYTVTSPTSLLRLVVGPEGVRKYVGTITSASDSTLKPYTTHFFEYDSGAKTLSKVTLNGECGCSAGSMNGEHTLTSSVNGSFSGSLANSSYDNSGNWSSTGWYARTIITRPDASAVAVYFDETGQGLGRVVGDSNAFSGSNWATKLRRDSAGRVTHAYSTAAISGYAHSTGAMTTTTGGLVNWRVWSSDSKIPYASTAQQVDDDDESVSDAPITISESAYSPLSITITDGTNTARLSRSNASSSGNYPTAGGSVATTSYSRTYWSGSSAWAAKKTTVTLPTTSHAYAPTSIASETYTDEKGRVIFTKDAVGKWTYSKFNSLGQLVKRIDDVKASGDSDAVAAASTFGVSLPATGFQLITQYAYDNQGRLTDTTMPDGRVSRSYYTKLGDGRTVTLSVPSVSGGTFTGPVSYSVGNLARKSEASGVIALPGGSTTTAIADWIEDASGSADVIGDVDHGSLTSLTVNTYDSAGSKVTTSRSFFNIPATYSGASSSTDYDETVYGYDGMGRAIKVTDPTGTITKTTFDSIGRFSSSAIGTIDGTGSNMTTVQTVVYDSGGVGNNHVTSSTTKVDSNTANDRTTSTIYDYRGRAIVRVNPLAPHSVSKYDNLGRVIASAAYSSSSGLTASTDPTSATTNRVALSETIYDVRGHAYQSMRHKITQSSGASSDSITTNTWIDAAGRVIKSNAGQLTKTVYDTLGRATNRFVLAKDNDSAYSDADDVSGDYVLEEHQSLYNATNGTLEMSVAIMRHPKDTSTTGALDAVNDAISVVAVNHASFKGRASITSYYYNDPLNRQTATVALGTNGGASYNRSTDSVAGMRTDDRLISETAYLPEGRVDYTLDPKNIKTKTTYDAAGRTLSTIANYVDGTPGGGTNGDQDQTTRYAYSRGRMVALMADLGPSANTNPLANPLTLDAADQVTKYDYGVVNSGTLPSTIASNRLLQKTTYPDSTSSSEVVTFAYNAAGQQIGTTDQSGNTITTTYDNLGRETSRAVSTLASGFNGDVRRIETAYDSTRGLVQTVTQYNAASAGSVTDQVLYLYDDWGNNTHFYQDVDSAMNVASGASSSGRASFLVQNTYAKVSSSGTAPMLRRTVQASPWFTGSSREIVYGYGTAGGINDSASRVETVTVGSSSGTQIASYQYLGSSQLVGTTLDQPAVETAVFTESSGVHTYGDLDNFGRVKGWDWARSGMTNTLADNAIAYDRNSNIVSVTDDTHQRDVSGVTKNVYDAVYTNDDLGRLIKAESGNMVSGAIQSGTRSRFEQWTLSLTGNWSTDILDQDGDGLFTVYGEFDTTQVGKENTFDKANKYTKRNGENVSYNAAGMRVNLSVAYSMQMQYDAFGRLVRYYLQGGIADTTQYRYNGLGYRIMEHTDLDADDSLDASERFYYVYDSRWRQIAVVRDADANPKEAFVYHNAGIAGSGNSSYIDSVILRDKD
ncbi:MAG TPA: hypothetical protein VK157_14555, partial [Phycisphaerales bacterium]|nr:hypothetical protein [Phycisphaerales bacterium]